MSAIVRVLQSTDASQDEMTPEFGILFMDGTVAKGYDSKGDAEADFGDALEEHISMPDKNPEPVRIVERMSMRVTTPWI